MSITTRDGLGNYTDVVTKRDGSALENDSEIILSRAIGDAVEYVYFRVEKLESIEVIATGYGVAGTSFTRYNDIEDMEEHLTYLIFEDHYVVIGGLWTATCRAIFEPVLKVHRE